LNYDRSRDFAWDVLIRNEVKSLPVDIFEICRNERIAMFTYASGKDIIHSMNLESHMVDNDAFSIGSIIFYDDTKPIMRQRFSLAHELGHILLHTDHKPTVHNREPSANDNPTENEANIFASRVLAPLCVLQFMDINSPEEISELCGINISSALIRFKRLCVIRRRNKIRKSEKNHGTFLLSPKERKVYENFKEYIELNKKTAPHTEKEDKEDSGVENNVL
jgi:Zn-dependent peptidase ImmA (M78 family)